MVYHYPVVVHNGLILPRIHRPFQFFNFMVDLDGYLDIVKSAWSVSILGDLLQVLAAKLRSTKRALQSRNKTNGNLSTKVGKARELLHATQIAISRTPGDLSFLQLQRTLSQDLWAALLSEEKLSKQKSRIQWLKDRDGNNGFFHSQTWNQNKILSIENESGDLCFCQLEIQKIAMSHFSLGSSSQAGKLDPASSIANTVTSQQGSLLKRDITDAEFYPP